MSKGVTPASPATLELPAVRLTHAARKGLVAAPHLADYARNVLISPRVRALRGPGLRRLNSVDLFETLFPELADERDPQRIGEFLVRWRRTNKRSVTPRAADDTVAGNVRSLAKILSLSETDAALVHLYVDFRRYPELMEFLALFNATTQLDGVTLIAAATCLDPGATHRALDEGGTLLGAGVLAPQPHQDGPSLLEVPTRIFEALCGAPLDLDSFTRRLFHVDPGPTLGLDAFAHLPGTRLAVDLVAAALREKRAGVNILLYGPPGTGKTAFASALAASAGARLLHVGGSDSDGDSVNGSERLAMLRAGLRMALPSTMLLFDEFEDVFLEHPQRFGSSPRVSKLHFNRLLEQVARPVVWTTNSTADVDPAFLRRFALALEFRPSTARQRVEVLRKELGPAHQLSEGDLERLGQQYDVSFAQLSKAVEMARLIAPPAGPERAPLEGLLSATERLVLGRATTPRVGFDPTRFRLEALNCNVDLAHLVSAATAWSPARGVPLTLCFYGPPGTGKTELAQHLAWRMGRRTLVKRTSDILSKWVGQTEQQLAAAFREATLDDAVLVFDEVDSLLRDRRGAQHSWEATQVNEFLQQLEAYRGVIVCTTNLWRELDPAALRRFAFKVEFRPLEPAQAVTVFRAHFEALGSAPWDEARAASLALQLGRLASLVPGDFAAVARRVSLHGGVVDDEALLAELGLEVAARGRPASALGFR